MFVSFRRFIAIFYVAFSLIFFGSANGEAKSLKLCYLEWGKFGGEALPDKGFIPDAMTRIFRHAGYEVEIFIRPWTRCIEQTKRLKFDLVADAWKGPTFDADFDYLQTHHIDSINFVARKTSGIADGQISSLKGRRVGYLATSGGLEKFYANQHVFSQVTKVHTETAMLRILAKGRVDVIVSDPLQLLAVAEKLQPPMAADLIVLEPALQLNYGAALISKQHPAKREIMTAFGRAFRALRGTNMYEQLVKKHGVKFKLAPLP